MRLGLGLGLGLRLGCSSATPSGWPTSSFMAAQCSRCWNMKRLVSTPPPSRRKKLPAVEHCAWFGLGVGLGLGIEEVRAGLRSGLAGSSVTHILTYSPLTLYLLTY